MRGPGVLALLLLLVALAPGALALRAEGPPALEVGDAWTLRLNASSAKQSGATESRTTVDAVEPAEVGGVVYEAVRTLTRTTTVTETRAGNRTFEFRSGAETTLWSRVADGATIRSVTETRTELPGGKVTEWRTEVEYDPPCVRHAWPLEVGKEWEVACVATTVADGRARTHEERARFFVSGEDLVVTEAGVFRALVIENATGSVDAGSREWFSPDSCAPVKTDSWTGPGSNATMELVAATCARPGAFERPTAAAIAGSPVAAGGAETPAAPAAMAALVLVLAAASRRAKRL